MSTILARLRGAHLTARILAAGGMTLVLLVAAAAPAFAQDGGGHGEPVSVETKLIAAGILVAAIAGMVVWAMLYRRMNRT